MTATKALFLAFTLAGITQSASAKECWALTNVKGHAAFSEDSYAFQPDGYSNPMVLCFDGGSGTVSGDDTAFTKFGESTLAGWTNNRGTELFEVYQIDRTNNKVLFTKARVGTSSVLPGGTDIVGAFVGTATRLDQ